MLNRRKTRDAAYGKWGSILGHLGYGDLLDGKHQDCPICSAKKKFRWTDYKSNGEWICTCGQGDGFDMIMRIEGQNFKDASKVVDEVIGNNNCEETLKPEIDYEQRRGALNKMWAEATEFGLVTEYLKARGIDDHGSGFRGLTDLRGHSWLYHIDTLSNAPGMCALIRNKNGTPISIHRTFFEPKCKKIMPPTEKISGAGVRLGWLRNDDSKHIVVGEGIETTLAGMSHTRTPGIAAISAHGMETLIIPKIFERIIILADNDSSFTGQKAAFTLARRMDAENRDVEVIMTPESNTDFLDALDSRMDPVLRWSNT